MAKTGFTGAVGALRRTSGLMSAVGCCLMLAACSQAGTTPSDLLALQKPDAKTESKPEKKTEPESKPKSEAAA